MFLPRAMSEEYVNDPFLWILMNISTPTSLPEEEFDKPMCQDSCKRAQTQKNVTIMFGLLKLFVKCEAVDDMKKSGLNNTKQNLMCLRFVLHVVEDTPAAVRVSGAQTCSACCVLSAALHRYPRHLRQTHRLSLHHTHKQQSNNAVMSHIRCERALKCVKCVCAYGQHRTSLSHAVPSHSCHGDQRLIDRWAKTPCLT